MARKLRRLSLSLVLWRFMRMMSRPAVTPGIFTSASSKENVSNSSFQLLEFALPFTLLETQQRFTATHKVIDQE
jgi:hypothetical protein